VPARADRQRAKPVSATVFLESVDQPLERISTNSERYRIALLDPVDAVSIEVTREVQ